MNSSGSGAVVMVVLDGWGLSGSCEGNAIALAHTPVMDALTARYPSGRLWAHGEHVGLAPGQMGNSNVGHLNLGSGRIVLQEMPRIDRAIREGTFYSNPVLWRSMKVAEERVHLYGLVSDGGVHSHMNHLEALLRMAAQQGILSLAVHAITDGRDTPPRSAGVYLDRLESMLNQFRPPGAHWCVATVIGRYWAMDRDSRWNRIRRAYRAMVAGEGLTASSSREAVDRAYERGHNDEFIEPTVIIPEGQKPTVIGPGDSVLSFNFRADRARQMARCLGVSGAPVGEGPPRWRLATLTLYDRHLDLPVAFPPASVVNPVGEVIASHGLLQLRVAETEKYAHVTYFYNGGREREFPGEDRILVPSPRVETYDLKPEMSAPEVTARVVGAITSRQYDFILVNYANPDMVGHTGVLPAAVRAVECVDACLGTVLEAVRHAGGQALVLSDHGNAEQMLDRLDGEIHTAHSINPVPCILVSSPGSLCLGEGILADAAPTVLEMLGLPVPEVMTARSLIPR